MTQPNTTGAQALSDALRAFVEIKPLGYGAPGTRDMDMAQWNEAHRAATVCIEALAGREQAGAVADVPVEMWCGERKITIYKDSVLLSWGSNIETEMRDGPRSLGSVQSAFDWLRAAPGAAIAAREQEAQPVKLTDAQCREIYWSLDKFGRDIDHYDYGLPLLSEEDREAEVFKIIRDIATPPTPEQSSKGLTMGGEVDHG